jgi:hypothetical protein
MIRLTNIGRMAKRKIGAVSDYIVPLALVAGGGYLIWKYLLSGSAGINSATSSNNSTSTANTASTAASDLAASQSKGVTQTIADSTISGYADSLFQLLANDGDPSSIVQIVTQVNNATDWYRLVQLFGTRQFNTGSQFSACALLGLACDSLDLSSALRATLPASYVSNINTYFSEQGINVVI